MVEIEVKSYMGDLKREFETKGRKHRLYGTGEQSPNYLYYLVPKSIADSAAAYLNDKNKKYGVLAFDAELSIGINAFKDSIRSVHKCSALTKARPNPFYLEQMMRRLTNEYLSYRNVTRMLDYRLNYEIKTHAKIMANREMGTVDAENPLGEDSDEASIVKGN
jgi:hypothetical protein